MRRSVGLLGAAGVSIAVVLSGCAGESGDPAPASAPAPSSSAPSAPPSSSSGGTGGASNENVAWMNDFCGQIGNLASLSELEKPKAEKGDVAGMKNAVSGLLQQFLDKIGAALDGLNGLPPAPQPEGDKAKQTLLDIFTPVHDKITAAKQKLDASAPEDKQALVDAGNTMSSLGSSMQKMENPMKSLEGSELGKAGKQAPNCQKLNS